MLVRGLPEEEREMLRTRLSEAFVPFAADGGYELPGAAPAGRELRTAFEHAGCYRNARLPITSAIAWATTITRKDTVD